MAKPNRSHEPTVIANATAATVASIYTACALMVLFVPVFAMRIAMSWFHGVRLQAASGWNLTPGSLLFGFITATLGGWIMGFVFAKFQNFFENRQ